MDQNTVAFILLLVFIFIARILNAKANKKLDASKKSELIDLFSRNNLITFGILIIAALLFVLNKELNLTNPLVNYISYLVLIFAIVIINGIKSYTKLKDNNFPISYIKSYLTIVTLRFLGLIIFFVFIEF